VIERVALLRWGQHYTSTIRNAQSATPPRSFGDENFGERKKQVGRLGATVNNLTAPERNALKIPAGTGVRVSQVTGAAEEAGVNIGDIALTIEGEAVPDVARFVALIQSHAPDSVVAIRMLRDGPEVMVTPTLDSGTLVDWVPRFLQYGEGRNFATGSD
jgi:hypothetical protein